jgi:hypothetical protein
VSFGLFWIYKINLPVGSAQHLDEEKTKGSDPGHDSANAELPFIQQIQLILSKIFLSEFVGALAEVAGEIFDGP